MNRASVRTVLVRWVLPVVLVAGLVQVGAIVFIRHVPIAPGVNGCRYLSSDDAKLDCVRGRLRDARKDGGITGLLEAGWKVKDADGINVDCHIAMHSEGQAAARRSDDVYALYDKWRVDNPSTCQTGFLHGVLQQSMRDGRMRFADSTERLCVGAELRRDDCYHGFGHGLALAKSRNKAIAECATVDHRRLSLQCTGGVFMQFAIDHHDLPDNELCKGVDEQDAFACGAMVPERVFDRDPSIDPIDVLRRCNALLDKPLSVAGHTGCVAKVGRWIPGSIDTRCRLGATALSRAACSYSTIRADLKTDEKPTAPQCKKIENADLAWGCYALVGARADGERAEVCATVGTDNEAACIAGASACFPWYIGISSLVERAPAITREQAVTLQTPSCDGHVSATTS